MRRAGQPARIEHEESAALALGPADVDLEHAKRVKDFLPPARDLTFKKEKVVTLRLDEETIMNLKKAARQKGLGVSSLVRMWVRERLAAGDVAGLMDWRKAPGAMESVPTSEHLDPLFVALGAAEALFEPVFEGWQLGSLSLESYQFA